MNKHALISKRKKVIMYQTYKKIYIYMIRLIVISLIIAFVLRDTRVQQWLLLILERNLGVQINEEDKMIFTSGTWSFFPVFAEIKFFAFFLFLNGISYLRQSDDGIISNECLLERLSDNSSVYYVCTVLTVVSFGFSAYLTPLFSKNGNRVRNLFHALAFVLCYVICLYLIIKVVKWSVKRAPLLQFKKRKFFLSAFFLVDIIVDFCWFLVFYPGVTMYDTYMIFQRGMSIADQHPWLYCLFVDIIKKIVITVNMSYETAFVIMSLIQIISSALVFMHCVYLLMREKINKVVFYLICFAYAFYPIFSFYTIYLVKDILFSLVVIEWVIWLYEFWKSEGMILYDRKSYLRVVFLILGMLLRNNGIYMLIFTFLCMLLLESKLYKKTITVILVFFCVLIANNIVESMGDIKHIFRETVGIPIQQLGAVVTYEGDINEGEYEIIDKIMPHDEIKEKYYPYCVDSIKFSENFDWRYLNEHKSEFLMLWAKLLIKNPQIFIEAYAKQTVGLWGIDRSEVDRPDSFTSGFGNDFVEKYSIHVKNLLPENVQKKIEYILYNLTEFTFGEGQLFWIFIFLSIVFVKLNGNKAFIVIAPIIGGFLTLMISTPGMTWRYTYYMALVIPLLIGLIFCKPEHGSIIQ